MGAILCWRGERDASPEGNELLPIAPARSVDAIKKLREVDDRYMKRVRYLEKQAQRHKHNARASVGVGERVVAFQHLKEAKNAVIKMNKLVGYLDTLRALRDQLEMSIDMECAVDAVKDGSGALKLMHDRISPEKVQELLDQVREQIETNQRITDEFSSAQGDIELAAGVPQYSEEELERELAELMASPAVATTGPTAAAAETSDEFERLGTQMQLAPPAKQKTRNELLLLAT